jgi:TetR/AcrR family transcriptional regulator
LGSRGKPEESRAAILKAAVGEFAEHGIAGARTDAIARAARVNKALLYYYLRTRTRCMKQCWTMCFAGCGNE